ncbi:taste receptor type 2 member 143-like [Perognathus longimembris pacificus]|uniref:taste receptor type 2 member 143-like n=1 Tax=Perognathus longimembris pacificus TaxID=214514 RepID=UPI00201902ED|nr:taste receptor type 2 member 143-like [Perognathus longimembris pacificus]
MLPTLTVIFKAIFCLESLAAMLQNGILATVLVREWMQSSTPLVADKLVACLALSRFFLHGAALMNNFLVLFGFCYPENFTGVLWDFFNTFILWLTAWLAIFYCVKVSSFSHPIFLWLKWRFSRLLTRLLLGSLILSSISAIIIAIGNAMAAQFSWGNCTTIYKSLDFFRNYYFSHGVVMWLPPFLLILLSIMLLMFSLCQHVGHMRDHRSGLRNSSIQAHTTVLKSLAFFLFFNTLYFLNLIIFTVNSIPIQSHWYWVKEVIIYAGLTIHTFILVVSSPKLRKALKLKC